MGNFFGEPAWKTKLERGEALPPKFQLSEELLGEMGVAKDETAVVLQNLQHHKRKTWGNLLDLITKGEEEVTIEVGDEVVGARVWNFFKEYNAKSERNAGSMKGASFPSLERDLNPLEKFVTLHLTRELEDGGIRKKLKLMPDAANDVDTDQMIPLLAPLLGMEGARQKIFVRELMPSTIGRILSWLENPANHGKALILGGNRGCGKTVIGALIVLILVSKGHIVLYAHHDTLMLVLPPHDRVIPGEQVLLDEAFSVARIPPVRGPGAYHLKVSENYAHSMFFDSFLGKHLIFVQDVGDSTKEIPPVGSGSTRLIVTSPNAAKLKNVSRIPYSKTMVLPTWKEDEIMRLDTNLSRETVKTRFERMGGIPRWVCDAPEGEAEKRQNLQIRSLSFETLSSFMRDQAFTELLPQGDKAGNGQQTDLVIRIEPRPGDDSQVQPVITSDDVELELVRRFVAGTDFSVQGFISATSNSSALAHFRGYAVEEYAHQNLTSENKLKMTKKHLSILDVSVYARTSELPEPLNFEDMHIYVDADRENEIKVGVYYRPKRKNEPTVDSWVVVPRDFVQKHFPEDPRLKDESLKFFAVFFQITVSSSHVVDGSVLKGWIKWMKEKLHLKELPMIFVFITTDSGITKRQPVTRKDRSKRVQFRDQAQFGSQYAIHIRGSFEELALKLQKERRMLEASVQEKYDAQEHAETTEQGNGDRWLRFQRDSRIAV